MARVELLVTVDKLLTDADLASQYLSPVSGASVQVNVRAGGSPATVYAAETGGTTVSNPLVTDAQGRVNGWVDEGSYVLNISGSGITSYNQPYEAVRGDEVAAINGARVITNTMPGTSILSDSIPNTKLAAGAVLGKHLSEGALPLGTIIAYWVPSKPGGGYAVPDGWAVCNGQSLGPAAHNFPGGGTIQLPNLIDKVPRGTDPTLAYGGSAGMNAAIGSNTLNLAHTHAIPHTHNIAAHSHVVQSHTHGMDHTHTAWVPDHSHWVHAAKYSANNGTHYSFLGVSNQTTGGFGGVTIGTSGASIANTGASAPSTSSQTGGTVTDGVNTANSASALSASTDIRDASVGVLYLIKVKNTV
jgi:hypothetical protein